MTPLKEQPPSQQLHHQHHHDLLPSSRSCHAQRSMSFTEDDDHEMQEESSMIDSPPRRRVVTTGSSNHHPQKHQTRRLFDTDDDCDDDAEVDDNSANGSGGNGSPADQSSNSSSITRRLPQLTLRRSAIKAPQQQSNHPLDSLDNNLNESADSSLSTGSTTTTRKRSEATPGPDSFYGNHSCSNNNSMYQSPRISPNSYRTMDGRFVQSKNPFSSPMLTDTPTLSAQHNNGGIQYSSQTAAATAPSLPESFYSHSRLDENNHRLRPSANFLPPRPSSHHHHPSLQPKLSAGTMTSTSALGAATPATSSGAIPSAWPWPPPDNNSFPNHQHNTNDTLRFTGSPIPEHFESSNAASSGSLHKVRRLTVNDDVVAASVTHLQSHNSNNAGGGTFYNSQEFQHRPSSLNTACVEDSNGSCGSAGDNGISPTDIQSFPGFSRTAPSAGPTTAPLHPPPPPTPVKQRPQPQCLYGGGVGHLRPGTRGPPVLARKSATPRSPYPGSFLHNDNHHHTNGSNSNNNTPKSRFHADFDVIGQLGKGSFGTVYKVLSRLDGCMYAIKAAQRQAKGAADRGRMLKEVYALAALSDQADTANFHIVRYHQAWMEDDRLYIQTELCSGTLGDEIKLVGTLGPQRRYKLLRELLLALEFIHRHNMVHLDIKRENIFLKNDQYKLGDFGLVNKVSASQDVEEGDSRYMSMELLSGDRTDLTKSDIFSLGATIYEICLGRPLPMNGQEWHDIRAGRLSPLPSADAEMAALITRMMDPQPSNRPTSQTLLTHPQLLSDEQKALKAEKTKVLAANIRLAAAAKSGLPKRQLTRANTWSGTSLPYF